VGRFSNKKEPHVGLLRRSLALVFLLLTS